MKQLAKLIKKDGKQKKLMWILNESEGEVKHIISSRAWLVRLSKLENDEMGALVEAFGAMATLGKPLFQNDQETTSDVNDSIFRALDAEGLLDKEYPNALERTRLHCGCIEIFHMPSEFIYVHENLMALTKNKECSIGENRRMIHCSYIDESGENERSIEMILSTYKMDEEFEDHIQQYLIKGDRECIS